MIFELISTAFMNLVQAYRDRVQGDSGTIVNSSLTQDAILFYKRNNLYDSIKFGWMSGAGSRKRTSTIYKFFEELYSFVTTNDATQTTESSQLRVTGNIAPGDVEALQNQNGENRFMTHPTISFAANEAWSVTTVLNWNGSISDYSVICGLSSSNDWLALGTTTSSNVFNIRNSIGNIGIFTQLSTPSIGKYRCITFVAADDGTLKLYIDGVFKELISFITSISFNQFFKSLISTSMVLQGSISAHFIRNIALTPSEVLQEATFLRSKYPEIPSVQIGADTWALRNCDMVATPQGNVIANVTSDATWATSQTLYDNAYAATSGTAEQKTYAAVKAAAMWCFYGNSVDNGAIYGKLYNWFAVKLLQMDIDYYNAANPTTPCGYKVSTEAEVDTLEAAISNNADTLKESSSNYWGIGNTGTNSTGLTILPGGYRDIDGTSRGINTVAVIATIDTVNDKRIGASLRLKKV